MKEYIHEKAGIEKLPDTKGSSKEFEALGRGDVCYAT
jgi:hypothetical protein